MPDDICGHPFNDKEPPQVLKGATSQYCLHSLTCRIISMDVHPLAPYLIAGSLDFRLRVWNLQKQLVEAEIDLSQEQTSLVCAFNPVRLAFAAGSSQSTAQSFVAMFFYDK